MRNKHTSLFFYVYLFMSLNISVLFSNNLFLPQQIMNYSFTLSPTARIKEFPLVDKLCSINAHNMIEWRFSCLFFTFSIFIYWPS